MNERTQKILGYLSIILIAAAFATYFLNLYISISVVVVAIIVFYYSMYQKTQ